MSHRLIRSLSATWLLACGGGQATSLTRVEPDAPERQFAGCYAVTTNVPDRRVEDGFDHRLRWVIVPDTIHLTLDQRHPGTIYPGTTWRDSGQWLAVRPDPWPVMHGGASWELRQNGRQLLITWGLSKYMIAGVARAVVQEIRTTQDGPDLVGVAVRWAEGEVLDSGWVRLSRGPCSAMVNQNLAYWWRLLAREEPPAP